MSADAEPTAVYRLPRLPAEMQLRTQLRECADPNGLVIKLASHNGPGYFKGDPVWDDTMDGFEEADDARRREMFVDVSRESTSPSSVEKSRAFLTDVADITAAGGLFVRFSAVQDEDYDPDQWPHAHPLPDIHGRFMSYVNLSTERKNIPFGEIGFVISSTLGVRYGMNQLPSEAMLFHNGSQDLRTVSTVYDPKTDKVQHRDFHQPDTPFALQSRKVAKRLLKAAGRGELEDYRLSGIRPPGSVGLQIGRICLDLPYSEPQTFEETLPPAFRTT